jgi:hypothetical protein
LAQSQKFARACSLADWQGLSVDSPVAIANAPVNSVACIVGWNVATVPRTAVRSGAAGAVGVRYGDLRSSDDSMHMASGLGASAFAVRSTEDLAAHRQPLVGRAFEACPSENWVFWIKSVELCGDGFTRSRRRDAWQARGLGALSDRRLG